MNNELENIKVHIEMLLSDEMRAHAFADKTHDLHFQVFRVLGGYRLALEERDRALEAVEKLREALEPFAEADCEDEKYSDEDNPQLLSCEEYGRPRAEWCAVCNAKEVLAATEPTTVELPKCDHCGASCGTDCDGSSHYTPEKKE